MENYKELLEKAFNAMENAYAPYSNYRVGHVFQQKMADFLLVLMLKMHLMG